MTTIYRFEPSGFDMFYDMPMEAGTLVKKTQPFGCPKNGTMGSCYVEDAESGEFYGLVKLSSLERMKK